jgi:hypothetical protein
MSFVQKFKDFFFKPDLDDHFIIEKWKKETDEADRLKELHRQSRKQENKSKKSLTIEDFERAKQSKKQKNKTLSSNF